VPALWLVTNINVRNGLVGIRLVVCVKQVDIFSSKGTVGNDDALNAHYAQLGAVLEAASYIGTMLPRFQMSLWKIHTTIVVSNPAVLLSLANPHLQGGQALITQITAGTSELPDMDSKINLRPLVEEVEEIATQAHILARDATMENKEIDPPPWAKV
jgi:hypothetical protein